MEKQRHKKCNFIIKSPIVLLQTFCLSGKVYFLVGYQNNQIQIGLINQTNFIHIVTSILPNNIQSFHCHQFAKILYFADVKGKIHFTDFDDSKSQCNIKQIESHEGMQLVKGIVTLPIEQSDYLLTFSEKTISIYQKHQLRRKIELEMKIICICFNQKNERQNKIEPFCFINFNDNKFPLVISNREMELLISQNQSINLPQMIKNKNQRYLPDQIVETQVLEIKSSRNHLISSTKDYSLWVFTIHSSSQSISYYLELQYKINMESPILSICLDYYEEYIGCATEIKISYLKAGKRSKIAKGLSQKEKSPLNCLKWTVSGRLLMTSIKNGQISSMYLYSNELCI